MTTTKANGKNGIERRTVRACEEPMVVVPTDAEGIFDVWTGDCEEPYVVDLAGEHDRCTCPDAQHNLNADERCKHQRRVRLEFAFPPYEDVPQIRSEHSAPMDVERARRRRGIDTEPEPITVDAQATEAVAATDGGMVVREGESDETATDGPAHADRCDNPECEGFDADGRPRLSFECWEVWA